MILEPLLDSPDDARAVARKIEAALAQPLAYHQHTFAFSAAVGFAIYPQDGAGVEALISLADAQMYARKTAMKQALGAY